MSKLLAYAISGFFAVAPIASAQAQRVDPGFRSSTLARNDDGFTSNLSLGFSANYFGTTYTDTFLSNNGYLTFNSGQSTFTPLGLGAGYSGQPIIAAFFADVDTNNLSSALAAYGTGTYNGRTAFGATWDGVGYFNSKADKLNSFQIILADRSDVTAGDFDIYLNYDRIQWETGDFNGGVLGLGGNSAAVGFNAGSGNAPGTFFELPGSRAPGSFLDGGSDSLVSGTNNGNPGQYLFAVRNGRIDPIPAVPEPASWAMMIVGFGAVGGAMRLRRTTVRFANA
ncbi:nidogen-like domain-containing protein [uncultured Sphingomonas sp.]|uniref:nidogen-like domain-containing protein n=1 Tax=uncultured Sphingomonas sp. TaxID=158754 RepID=UPI0035CC1649